MKHMVKLLSTDELFRIMSCLEQFVNTTELSKDKFYVISVWYPNIANKFFNSNTQPNEYMIRIKYEENYTQKNLIAHAKQIYNRDLIPIEIIQDSGAYFYAIPKIFIETKNLRSTIILPAEHSIPLVKHFI